MSPSLSPLFFKILFIAGFIYIVLYMLFHAGVLMFYTFSVLSLFLICSLLSFLFVSQLDFCICFYYPLDHLI